MEQSYQSSAGHSRARLDVLKDFEEVAEQLRGLQNELTDRQWDQLDSWFHEKFDCCHERHMPRNVTIAIAVWQLVIGAAALTAFLWLYPRAVKSGPSEPWLLVEVCLAAVMGSFVQTATVFTMRLGKGTLERGYVAWYLMRPFVAGLLGALFGLAVLSGLLAISASATGMPGLAGFVTLGALAGLFTDRVLQMMQAILGASSPDSPGSRQKTPGTPGTPEGAPLALRATES